MRLSISVLLVAIYVLFYKSKHKKPTNISHLTTYDVFVCN